MSASSNCGLPNKTMQPQDPIIIALPLREGLRNVNAFYAPLVEIEPVRAGNFVGDTRLGGVVNFKNVRLNPHGNGTHTECVGHIATEPYTLPQCLQHYWFAAQLISIYPQATDNGDRIITAEQLQDLVPLPAPEALIIRTLPNDDLKMYSNYSGANPPYLHHQAAEWIAHQGIAHLLIDLPSVDREEDGGKLLAHKAFWQYPHHTRLHSTITELIYVPNHVKDGAYYLNLMVTALELDASPSMPVLYRKDGLPFRK